jgi:hypothetical protein
MEVDDLAPPELRYHSVDDASTGTTHVIAARLARCKHAPDALDEAVLGLTVIDGASAWVAEGTFARATATAYPPFAHTASAPAGLTEADLGVVPNRMRHTLEALAGMPPLTEEYVVKFRRVPAAQAGGAAALEVEVEWDQSRHGKDVTARIPLTLEAAPDAARAVREAVLGGILRECGAVAAEAAALEEECGRLTAAAEAAHARLEPHAAGREARDDETALKIAALLVSKQEKLEELRGEVNKG